MAKSIIFGCVTDQQPPFSQQAVRLVASLRGFGGSLADAPFIVCSVDGIPAAHAEKLERLGAKLHPVPRFDSRHGPSNKLRFLELPELEEYDVVALLDCDTLIVQDPAPHLPASGFAAKPADMPTVTTAQFNAMFSRFGLAPPPAIYRADITGTDMYPYFNAGVCLFARDAFTTLRDVWIRWNRTLLDAGDMLDFRQRFTDQASLTLALAETKIPITMLPSAMNLPAHFDAGRYPQHFQSIDPVIIHYHQLADADGITEFPLAAAWRRAQKFNAWFEKEALKHP